MYSTSVGGRSSVLLRSRKEDKVLTPGGAEDGGSVGGTPEGCAGGGGGFLAKPVVCFKIEDCSVLSSISRGPVAPGTMACLRSLSIFALYASWRSDMFLWPCL